MSFVHLHNHTHYSLLDGLTKIDELVDFAKEQGSPAVAITDHGVMYGVIEFYQKCKKAGIKPILGVEAYLAPRSRHDKIAKAGEKTNYHLVLLAKNLDGYKNLLKLTSIAHLEGFYYKPRIDWEVLEKYKDGLIASTACLGGEIPYLIRVGKIKEAKKRALEYNSLFGQDNFYLELMHHPSIEELGPVNEKLIEFSRELNIPLIATNDSHYLRKEDDEAQDILLCIQNKKLKEDENRMSMMKSDFSVRPNKQMIEDFAYVPEAIENTLKIAEKCNVKLELGSVKLPYFNVPDGFDGDSYLRKLCEDGLQARYGKTYEEVDEKIRERMDYELNIIIDMGWPSYFLIVADFVNWSKDNGITVGPGRGSAAGSLVSYLIGITNLDPLEYGLLFERFLNPDRVSMPDIDLDFSDIRRDDVINYVEEKYGNDHVAQIITFGTMAARASVRDVGRVLGVAYDYCDKLAKMIPMFMKLKDALETVPELKDIYEKEDDAKTILDYAKRLEGVARHSSVHACGVLITKDPLNENVPVQYASSADKSVISQYSLKPVDKLGLLKVDFLGLKNLTIIESAIKIIKNTCGVEIDIGKIPLDDKTTYELFQNGETTGVFQFESSGMKRYLRELKPTKFEDIIAMVALYRPGPMEWIPDYIDRKHGRKKIEYLHPKLEPVLKNTYGVAIYQEQIMQIARNLAGFSLGEADVLRKAVGKKIVELLATQKEKFIEGCVRKSIPKKMAEKVFSFIEPFAGYGFNRSHAACYALIGYQTAYLKAHYPAEFMAALLTADQENTDRIAIEIDECRNMGINIMPPDINESFATFTVVTLGTKENKIVGRDKEINTIRFGLRAIKNVGENIVEVLIKERKENGAYKDIFDVLERVTDKDLNKKSLDALIKSGSFDQFGDRGKFLANMEKLLSFSKEVTKEKNSGQNSLFGNTQGTNLNKINLSETSEISQREKLNWEKELLGLYITEHPFNEYKKYLRGKTIPLSNLKNCINAEDVPVAGVITQIKKITTRSNEPMLFVKIEDDVSNIEILVFPKLLKETIEFWEDGKVVVVAGKVSNKDNEIKLLANKVGELLLDDLHNSFEEFKKKKSFGKRPARNSGYNHPTYAPQPQIVKNPLKIIFKENLDEENLDSLRKIILANPGDDEVYFKINSNNKANIVKTGFRVSNNNELRKKIKNDFEGFLKIVDA